MTYLSPSCLYKLPISKLVPHLHQRGTRYFLIPYVPSSIFHFLPSSVPDRAPVDLNAWKTASTEFHVTWRDVPDAYKNGIIQGFRISYAEANGNSQSVIKEVSPEERWISITGLKKFTLYNITILAFTRKGSGVSSSKIRKTDQDGKSGIFLCGNNSCQLL